MTATDTELDLNPQKRLANLLDSVERGEMRPEIMNDFYTEHGEPLKGEFVRVAGELERISHGAAIVTDAEECWQCYCARTGKQRTNGPCRCSANFRSLTHRRAELLRTLTAMPCGACEGKGCLLGCAGDRHNPTCPTCDGSGDLLKHPPASHPRSMKPRLTPHLDLYAGGRVPEVMLVPCEVGELGEVCRKCNGVGEGNWWSGVGLGKYDTHKCSDCCGTGFRPSPWAAAVAKLSHLRGFRVTDREPLVDSHTGWASWRAIPPVDRPDYLPRYLFDALRGFDYEFVSHDKEYRTPELAHAALSQASLALVRGAAP